MMPSRLNRRHFLQSLAAGGLSLAALEAQAQTSRPVQLGIDVLRAGGYRLLRGKRVGLLTHPAGVDSRGQSTIEILRNAPEVNLRALYGPEHGIDGTAKADVHVPSSTDPRTGLPVHSLYGETRKPTPAQLRDIDIMVVDLQDVGVRSYTYVSALRYTMEACFEQGKTVVVLDRPNPLGGLKVDGPMLEDRWRSYVGAYPVPYVHGLTIAELARLAKGSPGVMEVSDQVRSRGKLEVVPMEGWNRSMQWPQTGLRWIPTSPAIPDLSAVMGYSMTGLGAQLGGFRHGYGTLYPFRLLQYSGKSPEEIATALRARNVTGLDYRIIGFQERGEARRGVYVAVTDWNRLRPTELSFHMMILACQWQPQNPFANARESQRQLFLKHVGDTAWGDALVKQGARANLSAFLALWQREAQAFQERSKVWWIYG